MKNNKTSEKKVPIREDDRAAEVPPIQPISPKSVPGSDSEAKKEAAEVPPIQPIPPKDPPASNSTPTPSEDTQASSETSEK